MSSASGTILLDVNANQPVGVYEGSAATAAVLAIVAALGRPVMVSDYLDARGGTYWTESSYPMSNWAKAMPSDTQYMFGFPVITTAGSDSFAVPSPAAATQLANLLSGASDAAINAALANIAKYCPGALVRPMWEQNAQSNSMSLKYFTASQLAAIFQYVAPMIRAHGLFTVWNPLDTVAGQDAISTTTLACYPGDAFVDLVGPDAYPQLWVPAGALNPNETNYPAPLGMWNAYLTQGGAYNPAAPDNGKYSLEWWVGFAKAHGKPIVVCETGCWKTATTLPAEGGTGDDPTWIENFLNWGKTNNALITLFDLWNGNSPNAAAAAVSLLGV